MSNPLAVILCIMPNRDWTVGDIRLKFPLQKLNEIFPKKYQINFCSVFDLSEQNFNEADIVIIQRLATPFIKRLAKLMLENHIPYIYEIDDFLLEMPDYLLSAAAWKRRRKELSFLLSNASAITTTTERLATYLRSYNERVIDIANCLPAEYCESQRTNGNEDSQDILLASTDQMNLSHILPALKKIQEESNAKITVIGPACDQICKAGVSFSAFGMMNFSDFQLFLRNHRFKLALLPLDGSTFSECKSPIKFFSYISAGITAIADDLPPYSDVIKHRQNGWLISPTDKLGWNKAISFLLTHPEVRSSIRESCSSMAYPSLSKAAEQWDALFQSLLQNYTKKSVKIHLPSFWDFSFLRYLFSPQKYLSLYRLLRVNGFSAFFRLFRKGM